MATLYMSKRAADLVVFGLAGALLACSAPSTDSAAPGTSPSPLASLPLQAQGSGHAQTGLFRAPANWAAGWSYDCRQGLTQNGAIPPGAHCTFTIRAHRSDGSLLPDNNTFVNASAEGQGVLIYHEGGEVYVEVNLCCASGIWTVKVAAT